MDFLEDLKELVRVQLEQKNNSFDCKVDPEIPQMINSDTNRLRQILINLISNSNKFTNDGVISLRFKLEKNLNWMYHVEV